MIIPGARRVYNQRMTTESVPLPIYLESGSKRTFAGALEWPGWCRGGKTEAAAIEALLAYAPRYAAALQTAGLSGCPAMPAPISARRGPSRPTTPSIPASPSVSAC
jgi:hypothetical protein